MKNNTSEIAQIELVEVIDKLSSESSFKNVFHLSHAGLPILSSQVLEQMVELTRSILFPGYFGTFTASKASVKYQMGVKVEELSESLTNQILASLCFILEEGDKNIDEQELKIKAEEKSKAFITRLPKIREVLLTDLQAMYNGDPAAKSYGEIIFCYPAIRAITNYRIAHELLLLGVPLIPRIITEMAHSETGIDIHPGATIGEYFCIDHGTGVVIGETCIIGKHVQLYQGVTLGAKSFPLDENGNPIKGIPRHPIIEDNVIIYSNSTILGRITIGEGATIGGNLWVTNDVAKGERMIQAKSKNKEIM